MPKNQRGRLKPEDEMRLQIKHQYLLTNFDPKEGALDKMFSSLIFDEDDKDFIENGGANTRTGRVERFLERLKQSGKLNTLMSK